MYDKLCSCVKCVIHQLVTLKYAKLTMQYAKLTMKYAKLTMKYAKLVTLKYANFLRN